MAWIAYPKPHGSSMATAPSQASVLAAVMRSDGLNVGERELLRHCREYFALPPEPTSSHTAIVGLLQIPDLILANDWT